MARAGRRRTRILASLGLGLMIAVVQATSALAWTFPVTAVKDTGCVQWGSQWASSILMLTIGNYHLNYDWDNVEVQLWTSACGPAAPYGSYRISSKKQITAKFWVTKTDVDSCTAGIFPGSLSCTATNGTTTVNYQTTFATSVDIKKLRIDDVRFVATPGGGTAKLTVTGRTLLNATEQFQVLTTNAFQ